MVVTTIGISLVSRQVALAVYGLAYWHYAIYWLAYRNGTVPLPWFKRDAVVMKMASLALLASVYFSYPANFSSILIVAGGFLLNAIAAHKLGSDRTYYGYEIAAMPSERVTGFPFSWVAHPMLLGNMVAYGALMVNEGFRLSWWPLASLHVIANAALLGMEIFVRPRRGVPPTTRAAAIELLLEGTIVGGGAIALAIIGPFPESLILSALTLLFFGLLKTRYSRFQTG